MATHIKYEPFHGKSDTSLVTPVPTSETDLLIIDGVYLRNATQLAIYYNFTKGSLTQAILRVYFSNDDGNTWYQVPGIDEDLIFMADAKGVYALPIYPADKMKITIQGTGTNTNSAISVMVMTKTN
jgi:hypothetical protein